MTTARPAPRLVLASTSPYRAELLGRLRLAFDRLAPEVDETALPGETPAAIARRLAAAKAAAVAETLTAGRLVIGSDQVADLDGRALGKPGNPDRAVEQLLACSGRRVTFHTGLALLDTGSGRMRSHLEPYHVRFRMLRRAEVERYVALESPLDAAGSFHAEGLGVALFEAMEGRDPTALIGLPLMALCTLLREAGLDPLA